MPCTVVIAGFVGDKGIRTRNRAKFIKNIVPAIPVTIISTGPSAEDTIDPRENYSFMQVEDNGS